MKRTLHKGDSIESVVSGIFLVVGRLVVGEPMFPRDASPGAAGFSYPVKSNLLELSKLRGVETSPVERALARCSPVFAEAVCTFDGVEPGVGFNSGSVGAGFVVPGAGVAPGGFGGAMVG